MRAKSITKVIGILRIHLTFQHANTFISLCCYIARVANARQWVEMMDRINKIFKPNPGASLSAGLAGLQCVPSPGLCLHWPERRILLSDQPTKTVIARQSRGLATPEGGNLTAICREVCINVPEITDWKSFIYRLPDCKSGRAGVIKLIEIL